MVGLEERVRAPPDDVRGGRARLRAADEPDRRVGTLVISERPDRDGVRVTVGRDERVGDLRTTALDDRVGVRRTEGRRDRVGVRRTEGRGDRVGLRSTDGREVPVARRVTVGRFVVIERPRVADLLRWRRSSVGRARSARAPGDPERAVGVRAARLVATRAPGSGSAGRARRDGEAALLVVAGDSLYRGTAVRGVKLRPR